MKKFDFTNPEQWHLEAFCVFANLSDADGDENESYWIAEHLSEHIEVENNFEGGDRIEWWGYSDAHDYADDDSRFNERGTCDHCGAHFCYGAAYENTVTGEHAIVGHICATNALNFTVDEYARKRAGEAMKRAKSRARADMRERRLNKHRREMLHYADGFDFYSRTDEKNRTAGACEIARDMRSKFRQYDALSVKQWAFLRDLIQRDKERAEGIERDRANAKPIPDELIEGRHTFIGEIVRTKYQESYFGDILKMLFRDERGFKLWGSVPSRLPYNEGDRIQFDAAIDRSDDDNTFGFFSRPTKAINLTDQEATK